MEREKFQIKMRSWEKRNRLEGEAQKGAAREAKDGPAKARIG